MLYEMPQHGSLVIANSLEDAIEQSYNSLLGMREGKYIDLAFIADADDPNYSRILVYNLARRGVLEGAEVSREELKHALKYVRSKIEGRKGAMSSSTMSLKKLQSTRGAVMFQPRGKMADAQSLYLKNCLKTGELSVKTKKELIDIAKHIGIPLTMSSTKAEMCDAIHKVYSYDVNMPPLKEGSPISKYTFSEKKKKLRRSPKLSKAKYTHIVRGSSSSDDSSSSSLSEGSRRFLGLPQRSSPSPPRRSSRTSSSSGAQSPRRLRRRISSSSNDSSYSVSEDDGSRILGLPRRSSRTSSGSRTSSSGSR